MALGPIHNAKDVPLKAGQGTVPNVVESMYDYFQTNTFIRIVKTIVNFQTVETETEETFFGVRQPFSPQQLAMKPEGQRRWKWQTIHALPTLQLSPDERILFNDEKYRVMGKSDFKEYSYLMYEIVEDYEDAP